MSAPKPPLSPVAKITGGFAIAMLASIVLHAIIDNVTADHQSATTAGTTEAPLRPLTADEIAATERTPAQLKPAATRPEYAMYGHQLIAACDDNANRPDQMFKGKRVEITGEIDTVSKDILGTPYVTLDQIEITSVQAMFPRGSDGALAPLEKGQRITVQCRIDGELMNIIGRDCTLK